MKKLNRQTIQFFILTLAITWILWLPSVLSAQDIKVPTALLIVSMLASFTPSVVGLWLMRKSVDKATFKNQMKKRLSLDFSKKWLLIIPLYFLATAGLTYGLTLMFESNFKPTNTIPVVMAPLVFLQILFVGGALGEEFGWRGLAMPNMLKTMNPLMASLALGLIWSLWHLPLFFMEGTVQSNIPIWQFMIQNTLLAFYYTWLYLRTRGNLWLMIYLHAVANTSAAIIPYWQSNTGRLLGFAILLLGCAILYVIKPVKTEIP